MERDKKENLNAKQKEEVEKMKRELSGIGMYDPGDTYTQMKAIMGMISESKDMARKDVANKSVQKDAQIISTDITTGVTCDLNSCQSLDNTDNSESQHLLRWRMNPFDTCVDKRDVPLQKLTRRLVQERLPFRNCNDIHALGKRDKILMDLSCHLSEIADLWYSRRNINLKLQWGSPIQVGIHNNMDKVVQRDHNTKEHMSNAHKETSKWPRKRKIYKFLTKLRTLSCSDDEDADSSLFIKKKKSRTIEKIK